MHLRRMIWWLQILCMSFQGLLTGPGWNLLCENTTFSYFCLFPREVLHQRGLRREKGKQQQEAVLVGVPVA